jgi:hypothetical protein
MTGAVPQVIVTLGAEGQLVMELPGAFATRRQVSLMKGREAEVLQRVLQAQLVSRTEIGLDGAPTAAQVRHWERHTTWPAEGCRFCIAEGRVAVQTRRRNYVYIDKRTDGVEIRRKLPKQPRVRKFNERGKEMLTLADLGLEG